MDARHIHLHHGETATPLSLPPGRHTLQLIEGLTFLVVPGFGLRMMAIFNEERLGLFRLLGLIALALAVYICAIILPAGI